MRPADQTDAAGHVPRDCPKYDRCSVPICPLDRGWHDRAVTDGEAVCPYLLELDKPGDPVARFAGRYDLFVMEAAHRLRDLLRADPHPRYRYIDKRIAEAAVTPIMIEQEKRRAEHLKRVTGMKKSRAVVEEVPPEVSG